MTGLRRAPGAPLRKGAIAVSILGLVVALQVVHATTISEPVEVTALAVADSASGFVGSASTIEVRVLANGTGSVFVDTKPLSQMDMQGSARQAARVAADTLGLDWRSYDFLLKFRSDIPVIGGPSAGGEMALAFLVALWNLEHPDASWVLDESVAGTGTINADGTIGPVGGIPAKAEGARDRGIKVFLYPAGQDVATTRVASGLGARTVLVDMQDHCEALDMECRPVSTLRQLLSAVAGVDLDAPDVEIPDTSGYEPYLGTDIRGQVTAVQEASAASRARLATLGLSAKQEADVDGVLAEADDSVESATGFVEAGKFYAAASAAFRARVSERFAGSLMDLYESMQAGTTMRDAVEACEGAATAAASHAGSLEAPDMVAWYAIGEAQQRAQEAEDLAKEATTRSRNAYGLDDVVQVLHTTSFCLERAQSSRWWAGMPQAFPSGPGIRDPREFAQEILSEAEDAILYGRAIGASGGQDKWQQAQTLVERQWWPAATRMAIQAMTESAVDVQAQSGEIPASVLAAARQAAAQAVARARAAGIEPLVSVSLIELASGQDSQQELASYWTARSLALMGPLPAPAGPAPTAVSIPDGSSSASAGKVWVGLGALLIAALVAHKGLRKS